MNIHALTGSSLLSTDSGSRARYHLSAAAAIGGGAIIIAGSTMSWMTLFAGLHSYSGLIGLNGKLLMVGGIVSIVIGLALMLRGSSTLNTAAGGLGVVLLAFTSWLLFQQHEMYRELVVEQPMTVPGIGSGLYFAAAGALLVALTLLVGRARRDPATPRNWN